MEYALSIVNKADLHRFQQGIWLPKAQKLSKIPDDCALQQRLRPGLAMSQDGRNWARIEGEHHTGALFEVGKAGEWDASFIAGPQVKGAWPCSPGMIQDSAGLEAHLPAHWYCLSSRFSECGRGILRPSLCSPSL